MPSRRSAPHLPHSARLTINRKILLLIVIGIGTVIRACSKQATREEELEELFTYFYYEKHN